MKADFKKWLLDKATKGRWTAFQEMTETQKEFCNQFAEEYADTQMEKFLIWIEAKERLQKMPPKYYKDMVKKFKDES